MTPMKAKIAGVSVLFGLGLIGLLAYSSMGLRKNRVEVCIEYQGREACRTAAGETRQNAIRTASSNACAQIASGMTDSMACEQTRPTKLRVIDGN